MVLVGSYGQYNNTQDIRYEIVTIELAIVYFLQN